MRANRKALGLPQETVAKSAGVNRSQIANIEKGNTNPSISVLLRVAWALDVEPSVLLPDLEDLAMEWGN